MPTEAVWVRHEANSTRRFLWRMKLNSILTEKWLTAKLKPKMMAGRQRMARESNNNTSAIEPGP